MIFSVTNSNCLGSILIVNCSIVSPTSNVNPTLFVIFVKSLGDYRFTVLQVLSLTYQVIFIQSSIIHDNISSQVADKSEGRVLDELVHICSLIQEMCHPKSCHIAHPHLLVQATTKRFLPARTTFRVGSTSDSHWLQ